MRGRQTVSLGLASGLGGEEGRKVEKFEIEGVRDWVVRGGRWREGKNPVILRVPINQRGRVG